MSTDLIVESDSHLFSALLKSYLRELPVPFLGRKDPLVYHNWLRAAALPSNTQRVPEIRHIINTLPAEIQLNVQYVVKFLTELSSRSKETKMTPHNIAICLGPTLLWNDRTSLNEQSNIERIIAVVGTLIESYKEIFLQDFDWKTYEDPEVERLFHASMNMQNEALQDGVEMRSKSSSSNHSTTERKSNSNLSSIRTSVGINLIPAATINITSGTITNTKTTSDGSASPNRPKRIGASFRSKFVS